MSRKNGKPGNRASTVTLLRRLASTAKKDDVKLRAIELLLLLEGKLKPQQLAKQSKSKELNALDSLVASQDVDSQDIQKLADFSRQHEAELLMLADR